MGRILLFSKSLIRHMIPNKTLERKVLDNRSLGRRLATLARRLGNFLARRFIHHYFLGRRNNPL